MRGKTDSAAVAAQIAPSLRAFLPFRWSALSGTPVTPWNQGPSYRAWARGSVGRMLSGQSAGGTVLAMPMDGGASPLPDLGELDIAPAMGLALGEAVYVIRSYNTPIAWFLPDGVAGTPDGGEWIQILDMVNEDYRKFSATTTRHMHIVAAALESP